MPLRAAAPRGVDAAAPRPLRGRARRLRTAAGELSDGGWRPRRGFSAAAAPADAERRRGPAVKMATPGMSWQQQHGYGGGSAPGAGKFGSGSAPPGLGAEHSPDLHFKMSKKIAQLTKVRQSSFLGSSAASGVFPYLFFFPLLLVCSFHT